MASKAHARPPSRPARAARAGDPLADPLAAFHPAVGAWFRAALGEPTRSQALAWPHIAKGDTTLLLAPTGSGKTLAAFLSAIDRLVQEPEPADRHDRSRLRVLYVSPLKALAVDVERNLRAPLAGVTEAAARLGTPLRRLEVAVRTGDTPTAERAKMLRSPPDILITTPESLYLLLTSSQRELLTSVDTVIIDEIHQMAASKRGAHLFLSLERLQAMRPDVPLQRIGLSATQRPLDEIARLLGGFDAGKATTKGKAKQSAPSPRHVAIVDASAKKALSITVEVPPPLPPDLEARLAGPLDDEESDPDARSIWPQVHARLIERIRAARSTMIFVNSRRLAERLATALNETAGEEIALAHHGSVAKDSRRAIEERLKAGELPAIVATSSLELGIDMGAVDQVIQVEAPPSVASGIQRIGRASHHVGGVPSGVLVPKHKHDLLACAAAASGIESGDVEETYYARNPLDVLAQQIVAIAAVGIPRAPRPLLTSKTGGARVSKRGPARATKAAKAAKAATDEREIETDVEELWELVRRAAPFAELPRASFDGVLDMLAGRYPSDEFADLRPRITWDRTRGVITPRAGSKRLAIQNAGTIPDRGLYGVFLQDGTDSGDRDSDGSGGGNGSGATTSARKNKSSRRVGELDEEMVFELREGEVFLLGASSWRAEQITRDRVLVTPAAGVPGKMPFWHGDRAGRTIAFGERIGKLTRNLAGLSPADGGALLMKEHHLDARSAGDLVAYVKDQVKAAGAVPSDRTIVVERVPDELGDLRICVLTPFGSRVHQPWAMAALRKLRDARAGDIEAVATDDGIVFRVPGGEEPPPVDLLFPSPDEIEDVVTRELGGSSLFAARFREAAARALLLPRQHVGKRTPLWAQRKRAADLLAVAQQYPSFPIVLETYRECLRDAFDLPALVDVLRAVESRKIRVTTVDVTTPSPMAASLLFSFVGNFIYDEDAPAAERRAQALTIDHAQLRELLGETELRKLLDADVVLEHGRQLQRLDRPLRHADALHDLLLWLGDLTGDEIRRRAETASTTDGGAPRPPIDPLVVTGWIETLVRDRRIVRVRIAGEERFVAVEDVARYRDALGVVVERGLPEAFLGPTKDALTSLVARYARTHGPFIAADIASRWGLGEASVITALDRLIEASKVVTGTFMPSSAATRARGRASGSGSPLEYCDAEVLRILKRKTLARLRKAIEPVGPDVFARFLCDWQGIVAPDDARAQRLAAAPVEALLRAIAQLEGCPIPASVLETEVLPARVPGYRSYMLDQLLASGEVCGPASSRSARRTDASRCIAPIASRCSRGARRLLTRRRAPPSTPRCASSSRSAGRSSSPRSSAACRRIRRSCSARSGTSCGPARSRTTRSSPSARSAPAPRAAGGRNLVPRAAAPPAARVAGRCADRAGSACLRAPSAPPPSRARCWSATASSSARPRRRRACPAASRTSTTCTARSRIKDACGAATSSPSAARRSSRSPAPRSASARNAPTTRSRARSSSARPIRRTRGARCSRGPVNHGAKPATRDRRAPRSASPARASSCTTASSSPGWVGAEPAWSRSFPRTSPMRRTPARRSARRWSASRDAARTSRCWSPSTARRRSRARSRSSSRATVSRPVAARSSSSPPVAAPSPTSVAAASKHAPSPRTASARSARRRLHPTTTSMTRAISTAISTPSTTICRPTTTCRPTSSPSPSSRRRASRSTRT